MGIWYVTREIVKSALDNAESVASSAQIDRAIDSSSRSVEGFLNRVFYPEIDTRYFDWPINGQYAQPWRLWLDRNELISLTTLTVGASTGSGTVIPNANVNLEPNWSGPPYSRVEIKLSTSSAFGGGTTWQRDIAILGVYGFDNVTEPAGALAAAVSTTTGTTVDVTDSYSIGVGSLVYAGTELMRVTNKSMLTTGQTLQTSVQALKSDTLIAVTDGTAFTAGETILLDAERMHVEDIAGNNLIVRRGYDGTVLAAHTGSTIYAPRRLTVERGVLGTTAATHLISAALTVHVVPSLVRDLVTAWSIEQLLGERSGYARRTRKGSGDSQGKNEIAEGADDIEDRCYTAYARQARTRAI